MLLLHLSSNALGIGDTCLLSQSMTIKSWALKEHLMKELSDFFLYLSPKSHQKWISFTLLFIDKKESILIKIFFKLS